MPPVHGLTESLKTRAGRSRRFRPPILQRRSGSNLSDAQIAAVVVSVLVLVLIGCLILRRVLSAGQKHSKKTRRRRKRHHRRPRNHQPYHQHRDSSLAYQVYNHAFVQDNKGRDYREQWPVPSMRADPRRRKHRSQSSRYKSDRYRTHSAGERQSSIPGCGHLHDDYERRTSRRRRRGRHHSHYAYPNISDLYPAPEPVPYPIPPTGLGIHCPEIPPPTHAGTYHAPYGGRTAAPPWEEEPVVVSGEGHPSGTEATAPPADASHLRGSRSGNANPFATPSPPPPSPPPSQYIPDGQAADIFSPPAGPDPDPAVPAAQQAAAPAPAAAPTSRVRDWVRNLPHRLDALRSPSTHHPMVPPRARTPGGSIVFVDAGEGDGGGSGGGNPRSDRPGNGRSRSSRRQQGEEPAGRQNVGSSAATATRSRHSRTCAFAAAAGMVEVPGDYAPPTVLSAYRSPGRRMSRGSSGVINHHHRRRTRVSTSGSGRRRSSHASDVRPHSTMSRSRMSHARHTGSNPFTTSLPPHSQSSRLRRNGRDGPPYASVHVQGVPDSNSYPTSQSTSTELGEEYDWHCGRHHIRTGHEDDGVIEMKLPGEMIGKII